MKLMARFSYTVFDYHRIAQGRLCTIMSP